MREVTLLHPTGLDADGATVLAIGAHADDIEIGAGGTLLWLRRRHPGVRLVWLVLSAEGDRAEEARAAAADFGADEVVLADFPDRFLPEHWGEVKRRMAAVAPTIGPIPLVLAPWRLDRHQDHRLVGEVSWQTFRSSAIWAYEIPKWEGDLANPNVLVALDDEVATSKLDLLARHFPSQHEHPWYQRGTFEAILRLRGVQAATTWAEGFHAEKVVLGG